MAKCIQKQHVKTFQQWPTRLRDPIRIRAVGHIAKAKPRYVIPPMLQRNGHDPSSQNFRGLVRNPQQRQLRQATGLIMLRRRVKRIVERLPNPLRPAPCNRRANRAPSSGRRSAGRPARRGGRRARACKEQRESSRSARAAKRWEVRRRIDQEVALRQTEHRAASSSLVLGIGAQTDFAPATDNGYAMRRARAEDDELVMEVAWGQRSKHK